MFVIIDIQIIIMNYRYNNKEQYRSWLQSNLLKPIMPIQEKHRRDRIDMDYDDMMVACEDVFYSGYMVPQSERCIQCVPFRNNYQVSVWLPKKRKDKILLSYRHNYFDYSLTDMEYLIHKRPDINNKLLPELLSIIISYC